jgi:hypothetical protein
LNGSEADPDALIATPTQNFYLAAAGLGYNVIALSYASDNNITNICSGVASCFYPTRVTLITGMFQPGAASSLQGILPSEGIVERLTLALQTLALDYPSQGWGNFLVAGKGAETINWGLVVTSGQSDGGGSAVAIAKLYPVARVIQLSATCDQTHQNEVNEAASVPAPWLFAANPATWGATNPANFWGLDAATYFGASGYAQCPETNPQCGDEICFDHLKSWQALGMTSSHQIDNEYICPQKISSGGIELAVELNIHDMSVSCPQNYPFWLQMLQ